LKKVNFKIISHLLVFVLFLTGYSIPAEAQQYEIGGGIGVGTYTGDIIRKVDPGKIGLQGTFFG